MRQPAQYVATVRKVSQRVMGLPHSSFGSHGIKGPNIAYTYRVRRNKLLLDYSVWEIVPRPKPKAFYE